MRLSSSKLPLLQECAWWARPGVVWDDRAGDHAVFGNAVHTVAELAVSGPGRAPGATLAPVDLAQVATKHGLDASGFARLQRVAEHLLPFLAANVRPGWVAEQPFAWDPTTGDARARAKRGNGRTFVAAMRRTCVFVGARKARLEEQDYGPCPF